MSWNLGTVPHKGKLTLGQESEKLQKDSGEDGAVVDPAAAPHPAHLCVGVTKGPGDTSRSSKHKNNRVVAVTVVPPKACTKISLVPALIRNIQGGGFWEMQPSLVKSTCCRARTCF